MNNNGKSLENWIWDAASSIRSVKDENSLPFNMPRITGHLF